MVDQTEAMKRGLIIGNIIYQTDLFKNIRTETPQLYRAYVQLYQLVDYLIAQNPGVIENLEDIDLIKGYFTPNWRPPENKPQEEPLMELIRNMIYNRHTREGIYHTYLRDIFPHLDNPKYSERLKKRGPAT